MAALVEAQQQALLRNEELRGELDEKNQRIRQLESKLLDVNQRRQDVVKRIDELVEQIDQLDEQLGEPDGSDELTAESPVSPVATRRSVSVRIRGKEYRILSEEDEQTLQRVARYLDETLAKVESKTGTVDSLDVALLTALNLARELVAIREGRRPSEGGGIGVDADRLRSLIELAESGLEPPTVPAH